MKKAIWETIKTLLRIAVTGAVGALLVYLSDLPKNATIGASMLILMALDRFLHITGKTKDIKILKGGLTRF